jgi:hypothetical protein
VRNNPLARHLVSQAAQSPYSSAHPGFEADARPQRLKPVSHETLAAWQSHALIRIARRTIQTGKKPSVLRHLGVHALGPRVNSPGEIVDFRESRLAQEINRFGAAPAHLAVGDDLAAGVEFVHATG